jgi:cyclohexyl-isocyanide hydratase
MLDVAGPLEMFYWAGQSKPLQRFLVSGNRLTGGGISSGLDESLKLIELLFGDEIAKDVQVTTQYFPKPPVMGEIPPTPGCNINWS